MAKKRRSKSRRGNVGCGRIGAIAVGKKPPVEQVTRDKEGRVTAFFSDAPSGEPAEDDCWLVCLHCLQERHPESREGLELARKHGVAIRVDGSWEAVVGPDG